MAFPADLSPCAMAATSKTLIWSSLSHELELYVLEIRRADLRAFVCLCRLVVMEASLQDGLMSSTLCHTLCSPIPHWARVCLCGRRDRVLLPILNYRGLWLLSCCSRFWSTHFGRSRVMSSPVERSTWWESEASCQRPWQWAWSNSPSLSQIFSDHRPSQQLDHNLMKDSETEPPSKATPGFLTLGNCAITHLLC